MADAVNWREVRKKEITAFVTEFYRTSWAWRSQAYHTKWDKWEGNYRILYDPAIAAKKEDWQSVLPETITNTNVEVIAAAVFKILFGRLRPIGLNPREFGDEMQAELHTVLLDHQVDRSELPIEFAKALRQILTFGNTFLKIYWERKPEMRRVMKAVRESFVDAIRQGRFPQVVGQKEEVQTVLAKNGVRIETVSIRDIFLAPNSTDINPILHRTKLLYGDLIAMSRQKGPNGRPMIDSDSVAALEGCVEADTFEMDQQTINALQAITAPEVPKPSPYSRKHTAWEYWGDIPRKWIDLDMADDAKGADELVPGKLLVASANYFLASEENPFPSMSPPFVKGGYIPTGMTYDMGVAQLLEGIHEELQEIRNQRIDNVNLIMNKIFAVLEKYVVDPNEMVSAPGNVIRLKGGEIDDVKKILTEIPISDVTGSAYKETFELERKAQEVSGANRVTTGSAGSVRDANQTLGGMELLRQSAADRFTQYAYLIGRQLLVKTGKKVMELIYQNMDDEMIKRVLGMQPLTILGADGQDEQIAKWQAFKKLTSREIEQDYDFVIFDVFGEENKFAKDQAMGSYIQLCASVLQQFDPKPGLRLMGRSKGLSAEEITAILGETPTAVPTPAAMGQGIPSIAKTAKPTVNQNPMGPNPLTANGAAPQ